MSSVFSLATLRPFHTVLLFHLRKGMEFPWLNTSVDVRETPSSTGVSDVVPNQINTGEAASSSSHAQHSPGVEPVMAPVTTRGQIRRLSSNLPSPSTAPSSSPTGNPVTSITAADTITVPTVTPSRPPLQPQPAVPVNMSEVLDETDRDTAVVIASLNKTFPAPSEYDDLRIQNRNDATVRVFGQAPWFDRDAVEAADNHMERYLDSSGSHLPGAIHVSSLQTFAWQRQFCIRDNELRVPVQRTLAGIRADFARSANGGLCRLFEVDTIPATMNVDMFVYRTRGEVDYVQALSEIPVATIEGWRGRMMVTQQALCFTKPQLRVEFRFLSKNSRYWQEQVRGERRARTMTGLAIPFQCPQFHLMKNGARHRAFAKLTLGWTHIEVPRGCSVELPPVFSYKVRALLDQNSGWWVVAYTEHIAKTAAFILFDVYDSLRLWALSPRTISFCRELDLVPVLGNDANVQEFHDLLRVIEATDYTRYPTSQRNRGEKGDYCLGRTGAGADYVYFCPLEKRILSLDEFIVKRRRGRPKIPRNYPRGFSFDVDIPGWDTVVRRDDTGRDDDDDDDDDGHDYDDGDGHADYMDDDPDDGYRNDGDAPGNAGMAGSSNNQGDYRYPTAVGYSYPVNANARHNYSGYNQYSGNPGYGVSVPPSVPPVAPVPSPFYPSQGGSCVDVAVVRRFLVEVGLPESALSGDWVELRAYLRGRLHR